MDVLDNLVRKSVPASMSEARIGADDFISQFNAGSAELVDIRLPMETAVWRFGFGLCIPADELPERLNELPQDKLLVIACPQSDRSNMVRSYLAARGFRAQYLMGGLLGLADRLKGGASKDLQLPS